MLPTVEIIKVMTTLAGIWLGGYLAMDKLVLEPRLAADRAIAASRQQSEREAQLEMVRRFVNDTDDLNDVFRAMTLLVRAGLIADHEGRLRREVERHFGLQIDDIVLSAVTLTPAPLRSGTAVPEPGQGATRQATGNDAQPARPSPATARMIAQDNRAIALLNGSDPTIRRATTQQLVSRIRNNEAVEQQVDTLIEQVSDPTVAGLSATGRLNTVVVLAAVSPAQWRAMPSARERVGQALDAIEGRAARGIAIGGQTRTAMQAVRSATRQGD
jgi:hypothetical protein